MLQTGFNITESTPSADTPSAVLYEIRYALSSVVQVRYALTVLYEVRYAVSSAVRYKMHTQQCCTIQNAHPAVLYGAKIHLIAMPRPAGHFSVQTEKCPPGQNSTIWVVVYLLEHYWDVFYTI